MSRLQQLLDRARKTRLTASERAAQRISCAFGNASLANIAVTRNLVERGGQSVDRNEHTLPLGQFAEVCRA